MNDRPNIFEQPAPNAALCVWALFALAASADAGDVVGVAFSAVIFGGLATYFLTMVVQRYRADLAALRAR